MRKLYWQSGISLTGFIVMLLVFVVFAFGTGWFANTYYANRLSLDSGDTPDFPFVIRLDAKPDGIAWDGQNIILSNRTSPWGMVRITPLENGQYRKASIPVVDDHNLQQISFQGISWNGTSLIALTSGEWFQSSHKRVFVELDPQTYKFTKVIGPAPDFAYCLTWDGQNYWAGTRFHTADQQASPALYKFDQNLKLVASFEGAGKGCQGMAWDGKYLWWGDVFDDSVTLYDITHSASRAPVIAHQYQPSIKLQSGIVFDGKDIWIGDVKNSELKRLQQDLYFDWLGGNFEVKNPGHLNVLDRFDMYQTGKMDLDDLVKPVLQGKIKATDISSYVDTLRSRYSVEEIRHILAAALKEVPSQSIRSALQSELESLISSGEIDISDDEPVAADTVKMVYFRAAVEDGDLIASWKVKAGDDIYSGIDAARPQQIPDDYDFYTFIQYTINITNLETGSAELYEFDFFENEDVQKDVILLQNIIPGEYQIDIEMNAQYYTLTTASHYNGNLVIKVRY